MMSGSANLLVSVDFNAPVHYEDCCQYSDTETNPVSIQWWAIIGPPAKHLLKSCTMAGRLWRFVGGSLDVYPGPELQCLKLKKT